MRRREVAGSTGIGLAVGGLAPIAVGALLVPFRDDIDNANLALILVLVVVRRRDRRRARRRARSPRSTATLAFDFFLTQPYLSMRIESADDIETALILLAVGLLVGEVAARGRRAAARPRSGRGRDRPGAPRRRRDRPRGAARPTVARAW